MLEEVEEIYRVSSSTRLAGARDLQEYLLLRSNNDETAMARGERPRHRTLTRWATRTLSPLRQRCQNSKAEPSGCADSTSQLDQAPPCSKPDYRVQMP